MDCLEKPYLEKSGVLKSCTMKKSGLYQLPLKRKSKIKSVSVLLTNWFFGERTNIMLLIKETQHKKQSISLVNEFENLGHNLNSLQQIDDWTKCQPCMLIYMHSQHAYFLFSNGFTSWTRWEWFWSSSWPIRSRRRP